MVDMPYFALNCGILMKTLGGRPGKMLYAHHVEASRRAVHLNKSRAPGRLIAALFLAAAFIAIQAARPLVAEPVVETQPDIFVLVYAGADGDDSVALTYPTAIPHAQAKNDLSALAANTGWTPKHVNIEDAKAPIAGSKDLMTSVDFVAHNVIPPQARYLPLEPVISALRNYHHVAITYMVADKYDFEGLRQYNDRYVSIALDARGNAYTYHVHIHDPSFQKLNLPLYQLPEAQTKTAAAPPQATHRVRPWQVMLVTVLACLAGGVVYLVMSRNTPA